jgi:hypothetical protein
LLSAVQRLWIGEGDVRADETERKDGGEFAGKQEVSHIIPNERPAQLIP